MSTQNTRSSGRRSGRGGPRRQRERGDSRPPAASNHTPKPPVKKSFWQKILGFFSPEKPKSSNGAAKSQPRPASSVTSSYPANAPTNTPAAAAPRPVRKPEAVEVTSAKLYVGNLSFDAAESDLNEPESDRCKAPKS